LSVHRANRNAPARANIANATGNASAWLRKNSRRKKRKRKSLCRVCVRAVDAGSGQGMIPQPKSWLKQVSEIARNHGALLIADEVMTGFGRTWNNLPVSLKTFNQNFLCLGKV